MVNLTPIEGNVHSFTAVKDTIIFDILTPYYNQETRFCNFYMEVDMVKASKPAKKVKREPTPEEKMKKGYKSTLIYLFSPPKINFKVVPCSDSLLE